MSTRTEPFIREDSLAGAHAAKAIRYSAGSDWPLKQVPAAINGRSARLHSDAAIAATFPVTSVRAAGSLSTTIGEPWLLHRTAEAANAALCLSEGTAAVYELLLRYLGWLAAGWRVFGDHPPQIGDGGSAAVDAYYWQLLSGGNEHHPPEESWRPVLLRVEDGGRLLALLAFWVGAVEVTQEQRELLAQVGRQLQILARRDVFRQGVLAREFEILRQGQMAGMAELAQGLSHELSQPLTALAAYAGALQRRLQKGQTESKDIVYLGERLMQQVERAGATLQAAKSFILQRTSTTSSVDVETTLRQLKGLVQPSMQAASVELLVEIAPGLPPARGSEAHVVQIVLGLLANAMTALQAVTAFERRIRIDVSRVEREIWISVIDNGHHAPDQVSEEQVPFFAAYTDSSRISLAISRSLAEIQGGRLWRAKRLGETVFCVALPLVH